MGTHSERKRFQAAQRKEAVERTLHRASRVLQKSKFLGASCILGYSNTTNHVRMAIQVFSSGVHNKISTELEWALKNWRRKCVVYH